MDCLINLIGIKKACSDTEPVTGLYINDLPGMNLKIADAAANSEKPSGIILINDRIKFASDYIANDIRNFMQDKFVINSILDQATVGHYKDNNNTITASNKLRGIKIQVQQKPYLNINISRIGIYFTDAVTTAILIYDLYKSELLYTIPVTTIANEIVYLDVNKSIPTNGQQRSLFICIDGSASDQYDASVYGNTSGCSSCSKNSYLSYVTSGTIDPALSKNIGNFISANSTGGLTVDYSIECDIDNYTCSIGRSLAWALLYKTGHLIMQELQNSDQLNTIVMINKARNQELLEYYEAEYIKSMNSITENIRTPKDICFQCGPKIKKVTQLP